MLTNWSDRSNQEYANKKSNPRSDRVNALTVISGCVGAFFGFFVGVVFGAFYVAGGGIAGGGDAVVDSGMEIQTVLAVGLLSAVAGAIAVGLVGALLSTLLKIVLGPRR